MTLDPNPQLTPVLAPATKAALVTSFWVSLDTLMYWLNCGTDDGQNLISGFSGMGVARLHGMPTTRTTATTPSSAKRVRELLPPSLHEHRLTVSVCVSHALVAEIKRIVKESEIMKYAATFFG